MDKNQSVMMMIVAIFVIVGIFIYFVFASNKQNTAEESQEVANSYSIDIDGEVIDYIDSESTQEYNDINLGETSINAIDSIVEQKSVNNNTREDVLITTGETSVTTDVSSPQTGPGSVAILIAMIVSVVSTTFVYKKQSTKSSI